MVSETVKYVAIGIVVLIVVGIIGVLLMGIGIYNGLVDKDTSVETAKGYVQSAYQRRADLIPNLVATVQGSADFEKSTLVELTAMRSQAGMVQQKMKDAKTVDEMQSASDELDGVLARLMLVVEAYPQIKTTDAFMNLQSQIEGTENRINYERNNYNDAVKTYKVAVRTFPSNIVAGMYGFDVDKWAMFEAKPGSDVAPTVSFDFEKAKV